jgi:hypothetical protein
MNYFKDANGAIFAFEADGSQDHLISPGLVRLTEDERRAHLSPLPTLQALCAQIDSAADSARHQVAGDPLRALEYEKSAAEAQAFAAAGYPEDEVPRTVAAWAINGRSARQAADSILAEAAAFTEALYQIRETRLQAKELVRQAMAEGDAEQAQDIAAEAIASIEAAVAGIGNNAG